MNEQTFHKLMSEAKANCKKVDAFYWGGYIDGLKSFLSKDKLAIDKHKYWIARLDAGDDVTKKIAKGYFCGFYGPVIITEDYQLTDDTGFGISSMEALKGLKNWYDWSNWTLADICEVSVTKINMIEAGTDYFTNDMLKKISDVIYEV
jgi:hypothetical protein